ncbi:hypothetical protein NY551_19080 [Curtobacterium flaccumfaciens pv. oortii]|uniref:hypothetical protein n=1 Tax=Curtobacterium flaccumfaciens TaxID=2035 RepID=UPI0026583B07|nr:hypothetical protein [Curtobacterium flaccumfaciens]MCS5524845.1 hypothetical protein [Curtobacterium flaccumfaciens pv. oortii]
MRRPQRLTGTLKPVEIRHGWKRFVPTKRRVKLFIVTFMAVWMLGSGGALAMDMASASTTHNAADATSCLDSNSCKPTKTLQPGELIPIRDMSKGGNKTLFETYSFSDWQVSVDQEGAIKDVVKNTMNGLVNGLMLVLLLVVYMTIGLTWWLFGATSVPGLSDASADLITGSSDALLTWVFPTAVAVGAMVAYIQGKQAKGSWFGQIAWMIFAGTIAVGLTTSPGTFTNGIDQVRSTGSNIVLDAASQSSITNGSSDFPIPFHKVDYSVNSGKDAMLRKTADSIWRDFIVSPWCLTQFGSFDACKRYAPGMLKLHTTDERHDYIKNKVYAGEGSGNASKGKDSATGEWAKGEVWWNQLFIVLLALVAGVVFCVLMLVLGFSALAGVVLTLMLLIAGVFFAALWIVPGPLRQWGVAWGETLVGSIMITFMALLTFSVTIVLVSAAYVASASAGWFISLGTIFIILGAAFALRQQLLRIVGTHGSGIGRTFLAGAAAVNMASRVFSRAPRPRGAGGGSRGGSGGSSRPKAERGNPVQRGVATVRSKTQRANEMMQKGSAWRMRGLQQQSRRPGAETADRAEGASGNAIVPTVGRSRRPVRFEANGEGTRVVRRTRQPGPLYSRADRGTSSRVLAGRSYAARTGRAPYSETVAPRTKGVRAASSSQRQAQVFEFRRQPGTPRPQAAPTVRPQAAPEQPAPRVRRPGAVAPTRRTPANTGRPRPGKEQR